MNSTFPVIRWRSFIHAAAVLTLLLFAGLCPAVATDGSNWESAYAGLLKKYVTPGGVRYASWKANAGDVAALQSVVDGIAATPDGGAKGPEKLAFCINAYNAWTLHNILAKYPTKGVLDGESLYQFFTSKRINVGGEKMSLNGLEKGVIIKNNFGEPRVHFALNCASRSCPPLLAEPFTGAKLDGQLDKLTKAFVSSSRGARLADDGKTVQVSKIFDFYKDQFAAAGGPVAFINKHRSSALPKDAAVRYDDYDWSLNEAK